MRVGGSKQLSGLKKSLFTQLLLNTYHVYDNGLETLGRHKYRTNKFSAFKNLGPNWGSIIYGHEVWMRTAGSKIALSSYIPVMSCSAG